MIYKLIISPLSRTAAIVFAATMFSSLSGSAQDKTKEMEMKPKDEFCKDGLVLWLDAADASTITKDENGAVSAWKDKSGQAHDAVAKDAKSSPKLIEKAMNEKPVIRFKDPEYLEISEIRAAKGPVSVFIVTQRSKEQASDRRWQRLISSSDPELKVDNKGTGFCMCATTEGKEYTATVLDMFDDARRIGPLLLGRSSDGGNILKGDIAEVLVFDRGFVAEDPIQSVLQYLSKKWGAKIARESQGWTRTGGLDKTPERKNELYPLSDQDNKGEWVKYEVMWDEFDGDKLDQAKWWDHNPRWKGREPALFMPSNVEVKDGKLNLTTRLEDVPKAPKGYNTFTSAAVQSRTLVRYGYFEIRAKAMKSHGSSAFWFYYHDDKEHTEIDVFEIGGGAPGFERKYNMNLHVFKKPGNNKHWSRGGIWNSPFNFADDYHIYGLEWDEKEVVFYVDGVPVHKDKNTDWNQALTLNFDSETMPTWFGMPDPKDLPSTFSVEYCRAWKKKDRMEEPIPGFK
ncbi:MAG: hypothetical protein A2X48_03290 [Lentisphaerae bacterium GWF2_49_21]|nr:MAG: hypothetical protein A2X48_03290 [Lentisphaerae bacterium GWF2_49_21]